MNSRRCVNLWFGLVLALYVYVSGKQPKSVKCGQGHWPVSKYCEFNEPVLDPPVAPLLSFDYRSGKLIASPILHDSLHITEWNFGPDSSTDNNSNIFSGSNSFRVSAHHESSSVVSIASLLNTFEEDISVIIVQLPYDRQLYQSDGSNYYVVHMDVLLPLYYYLVKLMQRESDPEYTHSTSTTDANSNINNNHNEPSIDTSTRKHESHYIVVFVVVNGTSGAIDLDTTAFDGMLLDDDYDSTPELPLNLHSYWMESIELLFSGLNDMYGDRSSSNSDDIGGEGIGTTGMGSDADGSSHGYDLLSLIRVRNANHSTSGGHDGDRRQVFSYLPLCRKYLKAMRDILSGSALGSLSVAESASAVSTVNNIRLDLVGRRRFPGVGLSVGLPLMALDSSLFLYKKHIAQFSLLMRTAAIAATSEVRSPAGFENMSKTQPRSQGTVSQEGHVETRQSANSSADTNIDVRIALLSRGQGRRKILNELSLVTSMNVSDAVTQSYCGDSSISAASLYPIVETDVAMALTDNRGNNDDGCIVTQRLIQFGRTNKDPLVVSNCVDHDHADTTAIYDCQSKNNRVATDIVALQSVNVLIGLQGSGMLNCLYSPPGTVCAIIYQNNQWPIASGDPLAMLKHKHLYRGKVKNMVQVHVLKNVSVLQCDQLADRYCDSGDIVLSQDDYIAVATAALATYKEYHLHK